MSKKMLDLYSDYLLCSSKQTTATGLAALTDGAVNHDQITRFLAGGELNEKDLWLQTKKLIRQYEQEDGCLIFDDAIVEKTETVIDPKTREERRVSPKTKNEMAC
jgi:hypothetical protein